MKKLFYSMLCIVAVTMFTACKGNNPDEIDLNNLDKTVEKCWKVTVTLNGVSEETYIWGTEFVVVAALKEAQSLSPVKYTFRYSEASPKDEESCDRLNPDYEEHYCWKVTAYGGMYTSYMWDSESGIKEFAALMGEGTTYVKADAKDEDACEKLNDDDPTPADPLAQYDSIDVKCWKVTVSAMGTTGTTYVWATEREAVGSLVLSGINFTHEVADAKDEDSCEALNNPDNPENPELERYDNTVEKCWLIKVSYMGTTEEYYTWGTEREAVAQLVLSQQTFTHEVADAADADACYDLGNVEPQGDKHCFELTTTTAEGQTVTLFTWETEDYLQQMAAMAQTQGYRVTYKLADPTDEDSCEALNLAGAACWSITATISVAGQVQTQSYNVWLTEELVKVAVEEAKKTIEGQFAGLPVTPEVTISYQKTAATDEDSCESTNPA